MQYAVGLNGDTTGIRVYKEGVEGYTLGDFSTSVCAGNLRSAQYEPVSDGVLYTITFDYGAREEAYFACGYQSEDGAFQSRKITGRLLAYCKEIFRSATRDGEYLYLKLVNAENIEKRVSVEICEEKVASCAKQILLAAEDGLASVPNVNTKENEPVKPVTTEIAVEHGSAKLTLPPQSVAVLICTLIK